VAAEQDPAAGRQVYRTTGAVVAWWAWLVFAVAVLLVLAVREHQHAAAVTAAVIVTVTGVMYACALRPRIVADRAALTVHNPFRSHALPWPVITKVELAQTLQVHYTAAPGGPRERVVHSWAVQSSGRAMTRSRVRARRAERRGQPEPGLAHLPEEARIALQGSVAEFIARQLADRVRAEHGRARPPGTPIPHSVAGPGVGAPGAAAPPGVAAPSAASPQLARAHWAWWPMAAIAVPLLALVILVTT
jgi:Bacterial PH domain